MANITGSIRLAKIIDDFWEGRAKKKLSEILSKAEDILASEKYFGYLVRTDKMGYLRALSKAKETFRGLNKEDLSDGMVGNGGINPLFVEMVEDFYYSEIRKEADINQLKLARYNVLRDELIARFEGDIEEGFTEEYAQEEFGISRAEMFEKVKKNKLIFAIDIEQSGWEILTKKEYEEWVKEGTIIEDFPLALIKD